MHGYHLANWHSAVLKRMMRSGMERIRADDTSFCSRRKKSDKIFLARWRRRGRRTPFSFLPPRGNSKADISFSIISHGSSRRSLFIHFVASYSRQHGVTKERVFLTFVFSVASLQDAIVSFIFAIKCSDARTRERKFMRQHQRHVLSLKFPSPFIKR